MRVAYWVGVPFALLIFALDRLSKAWVQVTLPLQQTVNYPFGGIPVVENLGGIDIALVHATNKGAAWGFLGDFQMPLLYFRIFLILCLVLYLFFFNKSTRYVIPFLMILSGALGNVFDTFLYGHVVDMIKVVLWGYHFPIFNIADMAISTGIGIIFMLSLYDSSTAKSH